MAAEEVSLSENVDQDSLPAQRRGVRGQMEKPSRTDNERKLAFISETTTYYEEIEKTSEVPLRMGERLWGCSQGGSS